MISVKVINGKLEPALKKFKRRVRQTKMLKRLHENKHFTKKSVKKRLTKMKAIHVEKIRRSEFE